MKDTFILFLNFIRHTEAKSLLQSAKENKKTSLTIKEFLIFLGINILIFIPLFFISNLLPLLAVLLSISTIFFISMHIRNSIKIKSIETLDKTVMNNSIFKLDFVNFLKNDISFNLKFSTIAALIVFIYQAVIYSIIKLLPSNTGNLSYFLLITFSFFGVAIISYSSFLIYFFTNRNSKSVFSKVNSLYYFNNKFTFVILLFIILFLPVFLLLNLLIKNIALSIPISLGISLALSVGINFILIKFDLYKKSNWIFLINKIKEDTIDKISKINIGQILTVFKSFKILYPLLFGFLFLILLTVFDNIFIFYSSSFKLKILQSVTFIIFFMFPFLKLIIKNSSHEEIEKPYILTIFIFSIFFLITLLSPLKININIGENTILAALSIFIMPLIDSLNSFFSTTYSFFNSLNILAAILIPVLFFIIFFISNKLHTYFINLGKAIDLKLKQSLSKQNPPIIFGDAMSLYPVLFSIIGDILIIFLLSVELLPFAAFFYQIFDTLQIAEIFKLDFLTEANIIAFFKILFIIFAVSVGLKIVHSFISALLSHFILLNDEIIYYENKIIKKAVLRIPLSKINYIISKQNFIEKLFDIGSIYIETSDKNGFIKIKSIPSIKEKNMLIMDKIKA